MLLLLFYVEELNVNVCSNDFLKSFMVFQLLPKSDAKSLWGLVLWPIKAIVNKVLLSECGKMRVSLLEYGFRGGSFFRAGKLLNPAGKEPYYGYSRFCDLSAIAVIHFASIRVSREMCREGRVAGKENFLCTYSG